MINKKVNTYKSLDGKYWHYTRDDIKDFFKKQLMFSKDDQLICLKLITDCQTDEELEKGESIEDNKYGWSKIDAYRMPRILKIHQDSLKFRNGPKSVGLTKDHWRLLEEILPNYWCQFALLVNENKYRDRMKQYFGD